MIEVVFGGAELRAVTPLLVVVIAAMISLVYEVFNEEHGDPADTLHHGRSVLAHARRRTHQEKNNAG